MGATPTDPERADRYIAVIFTSQRTGDDEAGYAAAAARMDELAAEQPGYLGVQSARDRDGLGITVSYWATDAAARNWKRHHEHLLVQQAGRVRWYEWYEVRVAEVQREYRTDARG